MKYSINISLRLLFYKNYTSKIKNNPEKDCFIATFNKTFSFPNTGGSGISS